MIAKYLLELEMLKNCLCKYSVLTVTASKRGNGWLQREVERERETPFYNIGYFGILHYTACIT